MPIFWEPPMTKAFWLSFVNDSGFAGACQVKVDDTDKEMAIAQWPFGTPHSDDAAWLGAALRKAHRLGINPGGSVKSVEFPADFPTPHPFDVLMSKADVERYDAAAAKA
jgi:hypothetical protein